ncbi:hypothetical protein LCGC14_0964680 [marine sediment metagenome]|uniref:Uncharacterized protein n=1 Tax=marine sediment metagenome TaxID=412755 RepID=A0A0F9RJY5_9ZZZZ
MPSGIYEEAWGIIKKKLRNKPLTKTRTWEVTQLMEDSLAEARQKAKEYQKNLREEMVEGYKEIK